MTDIDEIRERWESTTPGPWEDYAVYALGQNEARDAQYGVQVAGENGRYIATVGELGDRDHAPNDAHAIANAPTDVAVLLSALDDVSSRLGGLLCDLTGGKLSKPNYSVRAMVQAVEEYFEEVYREDSNA